MTEEEAKTKPCIGPDPSNTGWRGNPEADGTIRFYCRGSACMAWRRQRFWWPAWTVGEVWDRKTAGFCGLAGRP